MLSLVYRFSFQYAHWEESQKDFRRARSVWERAIDVDYTNTNFWLKVGGGGRADGVLLLWCGAVRMWERGHRRGQHQH